MACCKYHDRLDQILHAEEYIGMICGSPKNVREEVAGSPGTAAPLTGEQKAAYCCSDCPTLIAVHRA